MNAVRFRCWRMMVALCLLGGVASRGIADEPAVSGDPVEAALADVRETCAGFFATDSTAFGTAATPAEFAAAETSLRPGPRGDLPVAIDFSREQAAALARDYRHVTLLGKERWYAPSIPLGITGIRAQNTLECDVFPVLDVADDSPAAGKVLANDVIIGANGRLFEPGGDPRVPMGYALAESETEALGGILTLQLVRDGVPMNVPIEIGVLGEWGRNWPYDCKKSRILADRAVDCMLECFSPNSNLATKYTEGSWWTALMLMGSGNDKAIDRARRAAQGIAGAYAEPPDLSKKYHSWGTAYDLLILTEYYLLTGDSSVLPSIEHAARILEHGQSEAGSWGHYSPVDGYGEVNQIGDVCFLGLVLARECGVKMDPVALPRSTRFFGQFAGGVVPYGNGSPGMFGGSDNGRNCQLAVAFHILGADGLASRFVRPVCYSYLGREGGHACSVFGPSWGPLGVALAPAPEFHMFMNNLLWYYELARTPEGGFYYLAGQQFPSLGAGTGVLGLGLMLPRKQLRILGAPKGVFGTRPPEALREAAGLYRDKKWPEFKAAVDAYLKKPGAEHADYAKGLLAAYERQEKHVAAVIGLIRENMKKGHASVVDWQLASLTRLLGQEPPELADVRAYLDSEEGQQAVKATQKLPPERSATGRVLNFKHGPELEIEWDALLPPAAADGDAYVCTEADANGNGPDGDWMDIRYRRRGWAKLKDVPAGTNTCWIRRTFTAPHADYRHVTLHTDNGGEVYLNGYKLVTLEPATPGTTLRKIVLGPTAAGAIRKGENVLAARLTGPVANVALDAGPRMPDTAALQKDLTFYCGFDEGQGTNVQAVVPAKLEGNLSPGVAWIDGKAEQGVELSRVDPNGPNGRIEFSAYRDSTDKDGRIQAMTWSMWVRSPHKHAGSVAISKGAWDGTNGWWIAVGKQNRDLNFNAGSQGKLNVRSKALLPDLDGGFHHYAVVYDATAARAAVYQNGMLVQELEMAASDEHPPGIVPSGEPLTVTIAHGNGPVAIDELAFWRRALDTAEIKDLCNDGMGVDL